VGSSPTRPTHLTCGYATATRRRFRAGLQFWLQLGSRLTPQRLADPLGGVRHDLEQDVYSATSC
jgi:hypothetical protein